MRLGKQPVPGAGVSRADIQNALNAMAGTRFKKILPFLFVLYLIKSLLGFVFGPTGTAGAIGCLACGSAAVSSISWVLLRRNVVKPDRVHLVATLIGISILADALAKSYLTLDTTQSALVIGLLLLGTGLTFLSWRWFIFLAITALSGWVAVATQQLALPELTCWSLALLSIASASAWGARNRIQTQIRLVATSLELQLREREEQLKQEHFQLAAQATNGALWYWDLKTDAFQCSPAWETLFGYGKAELGATVDAWFDRVHPVYQRELRDQLSAYLVGRSIQFENEHRLLRRDGTYTWVLARAKTVRDQSGKTVGLAGSLTEISSLIDVEKRLLNDSFHDKLTSLPNRQFFMVQLEKAIEQTKGDRRRAPRFAVMFLDLDRFKIVNDSLGHSAGDELLIAVAGRLRSCARPEDCVARFGGDEFVLLLNRIGSVEEAFSIGNRIQSALSAPFQIAGREVLSGASIGIALSTEETDRSEDFLRYADIAMYQAKSKNEGAVRIFDEDMNTHATKLCDLQNDLRRALDRQQFVLHYQPTVSMHSGKILGVEALIRWQRPKELVAPTDFIPMAEDLGLINDIGEWALRSACAQSMAWQRAGMPHIRMAVNISAPQLQQRGFTRQVRQILSETGLSPDSLELELTETALIDSLDRAPAALTELWDLGVGIAIDDFGTGYSSLNYLRQFNFRTLKMDRCFVSDIILDKKAAAVARGVIALAHDLDLSVVAEGVEHDDQRHFLEAQACDQFQGFLASRPLPSEQFAKLLRANDPLIALPMLNGDLSRLASVHARKPATERDESGGPLSASAADNDVVATLKAGPIH